MRKGFYFYSIAELKKAMISNPLFAKKNLKICSIFAKSFPLLLVIFILILLKPEIGKGQLYEEYHQLILKAEDYYFLHNNVDSALANYQKCFETFDFVFARDAVNAFQIAYREQHPIEYFLKTAFESGVSPSILSSIRALTEFTQDSLPKLEIIQDYELYRSRYLDRINVKCLNQIYRLGIKDQYTKYFPDRTETGPLFKLALEYGLPGEKNCGIEELGIHEELGRGAEDFLHLRDSISEGKSRSIRYYSLEKNSLLMHIPIVIMLHDYCTYKYFEKDLHQAYLEGFIHPREVALIYDNAFGGNGSQCLMVPNKGMFGFTPFIKQSNINVDKANLLRKKWEICSLETDKKKKEMQKHGFKFIWDYW